MTDAAEHGSHTVFVKGVSFAVEKDALEEAFGNVGPIRNCFLVRKKGEERHKGCGYVQFALREDAAAAVQQMQGAELGGRKLKVHFRVSSPENFSERLWDQFRDVLPAVPLSVTRRRARASQVEFAEKRPPLAERKRKAEDGGDPAAAAKAPRLAEKKGEASAVADRAGTKPVKKANAPRQQQTKSPGDVMRAAAAAEKQRLVMTVAVGGIPPGRRDHVTKLSMSAGKVKTASQQHSSVPLVHVC